jgi:thiamine biosynthesis protein ThiI
VSPLAETDRWLLLAESGECYTKSNQTRRRFSRVLDRRLRAALAAHAPAAELVRERRRLLVRVPEEADVGAAARAVARVFGIQRVSEVVPLREEPLEALLAEVAERARDRVTGRTFAVRLRARGNQRWKRTEVAADLGSRLFDDSAGVDLDSPEVEVRVEAYGDWAFLVERSWEGPGGLPLGSQGRVATLISGGFDSAVAAGMVMGRGCATDFVHVTLECAQSDHATAVAHHLARDWAAGTQPTLWLLDFQPVRAALLERVRSQLRQVVLKQVMLAAADRVAERAGYPALVTGESIGQVSSQTLLNLAEIDRAASRPVLRPLTGLGKQEIIERARQLGTHDLSVRAKEVCDLSDGPVSVAATADELADAAGEWVEPLVDTALAGLEAVDLATWMPGAPAVPVAAEVPAEAPLVRVASSADAAALPADGPLALTGPEALPAATRLVAEGRDVRFVPRSADTETTAA